MSNKIRLDRFFKENYKLVERNAERIARSYRNLRISGGTLVHAAYAKLSTSQSVEEWPTAYMNSVVHRALDQVAKDHARRNAAEKRGGDALVVPVDDFSLATPDCVEGGFAVDEFEQQLYQQDERLAQVFECRCRLGLSSRETAQKLQISEATVERKMAWVRAAHQSWTSAHNPGGK